MNRIKIFAVSFLLILTGCSEDNPVKKKDPLEVVNIIATGSDIITDTELVRLFSETTETSNIAANSSFKVFFSKDVAPITATAANINITKNGDAIPAGISVNAKMIVITPEDDLELGTDYILSIGSALKAVDGGIFSETSSNFTTQSNPLESGLVAHYTFENGLAQDKSGMSNNGAITGAQPIKDRSNRDNESLKFESEGDRVYVASPGFLNTATGTFATWVKFDNLDNTQYLASVGDESNTTNYMAFVRIDGTDHSIGVYWRNNSDAVWLKSSAVVNTGVYYHIVVVADGEKIKVYVNDEKIILTEFQGTNTGKWIGDIGGLDNFVIGNVALQTPHPLPNVAGNLDEVRLYNRPLSEREITLLYTLTK